MRLNYYKMRLNFFAGLISAVSLAQVGFSTALPDNNEPELAQSLADYEAAKLEEAAAWEDLA